MFDTDSVYSEPAEVQRQLSHYRSMPLANTLALSAPEVPKLPGDKLLYCEFCDFSSEHQSSLRRHYVNIHGKKLLRCKDCSFFTGIRKTLDLHKEMGHSSCQMEPTHKKTLRCPLCLYHTKNQNHMIDHIVLHRQERVVPIEVRRPKLSRYLKGIVFRCHQCTFTSGNASNLRTHALKHDNVRPYQCRLCYFDCTQLSELEAHLCDKHQVVRNHEMVGQVNLDHLEMRAGHEPEGDEEGDEEDGGSNPREGNDEDKEVETDGCDDVRQQEKNTAPAPLHRESSGGLAGHAQRVDGEVGSAGRKEEAARQPGPAAEPAVLSSKCFRGAGFGSDPRGKAESKVEEDGQNYKSSPDTETQKPITAAGGQLFAATHVTNCVTRTADVKLLEKPLLSLEDEQAYGRKCDDGLGSPEMPVLENVYLNNQRNPTATRQDATGDSRRGDTRERRETPDEIPGEGPVNECLVRDLEAAKATEEAGTLSSKGAAPEGPAGGARRSSQADGALSCSLCGRLFSNGAKLQHHVKRHGM
ncbi:Zinc finger protein 462 [Merluccius polli]|uniref:Zinc finger protein 462 n=1 Tax=Merluccius polli TaxID=89951 RepID=A0AA47MN39_MERPO|nr:Zinc finger protein 462 [Merluccius polli]